MRTLAAIFLWLVGGGWTRTEPFDPFHQATIMPPPGARAPMATPLRDQSGRAITLEQLSGGKPLVLIPVQYRCPSLCGLTLSGAARAAALVAASATVVSVGIDPRETPADAAGRLSTEHVSGLVALTGDSAAITRALGFRYAWDERMKQYAHISAVAVLKSDGRLVRWLAGPDVDGGELAAALREAHGGPAMPISQRLLLLCYHLASNGGAYDQRVVQGMRFAGGLTLLAVLALVGWLAARERRRSA